MDSPAETASRSWLPSNSTLKPALVSSVLCSLAFPPLAWGWLVWIAPIGWLSVVARKELVGRRPYRTLWFAGFVFWMLTIHWIRLPHPVNYLGWVVLSGYLGTYLPAFIALSRVGVHRLRLPLWIAAPIVWTGLDWVRGHLITGFLMGSLAHTQVEYLPLIQVASLVGEYGVTFLVIMIAACITESFRSYTSRPGLFWLRSSFSLQVLVPGIVALAIVLTYGGAMYIQHEKLLAILGVSRDKSSPRIAIIQGNTPVDWKVDPNRQAKIMEEHARLTREVLDQTEQAGDKRIDLIIWPETMYRNPWFTLQDGFAPPEHLLPAANLLATKSDMQSFTRETGSAFLTGIDRLHVYPHEHGHFDYIGYNSSVMVGKHGQVVGTYDKMHLVMMGEYVPFSDWIPLLKRLTPMTGFAAAGESPTALESDSVVYCPNICYETCVPHLIRRHVNELTDADTPPDVLVNLTNDAWFRGSSELDMHLACGIFRAVEMRLPLVIAANGGLSGWVDPYGTVRQVTPRQQTATLVVDLPVPRSPERTFYARYGDWFAGLCVVCCVVLAIVGRRNRQTPN